MALAADFCVPQGAVFHCSPYSCKLLEGLLTPRWRQKSQGPTVLQIADMDTGVINWINADLVTHIAPRA